MSEPLSFLKRLSMVFGAELIYISSMAYKHVSLTSFIIVILSFSPIEAVLSPKHDKRDLIGTALAGLQGAVGISQTFDCK